MTSPAALENPVVAPPRDTPDEQGFLTKLGSAFAMFRNGKSIAGLVILGVFILVAIFADFIAPASPTAVDPKARLSRLRPNTGSAPPTSVRTCSAR